MDKIHIIIIILALIVLILASILVVSKPKKENFDDFPYGTNSIITQPNTYSGNMNYVD
jgi:hypothetical protein